MKKKVSGFAAVLVLVLTVGAVVTPAGAHITNKFGHLWGHIKTRIVKQGYSPVVASTLSDRGFQELLPADGTAMQVGSTATTGTGALKVPFRARIQAEGAVSIARNPGGDRIAKCYLTIDPPGERRGGRISADSLVWFGDGSGGDTIPLVGYADVGPGTYDIGVSCYSGGGAGWSDASINAMAIRR